MSKSCLGAASAVARALAIGAIAAVAISCTAGSAKNRQAGTAGTAVTTSYVEGRVSVARANSPGVLAPLGAGEALAVGDSVVTGSDGCCSFDVPGIGSFELGPGSRVTIDAHVLESRRGALSLGAGSVKAKIERLGGRDSLILRTPSIVCGVRGTVFTASILPEGALALSVAEGTVSVFPEALLANALHPAAELLGGAGSRVGPAAWENDAIEELLDGLPTVTEGREVLIPGTAMENSVPAIERLAASLTAETDATETRKLGQALVEALRESLPRTTPITDPDTDPDTERQRGADTGEGGDTTRFARDNYSYTVKKIREPEISETRGDAWLRPEPVRSKPVDKTVLVPMNDKTAHIVVNKDKKGATGAFERGRARLKVAAPDPVEWLALVSIKEPFEFARGALYLAECTAWTNKVDMRVTFCISEGAVDRNGDGAAYGPYSYNIFPADAKARRFSFLYCHDGATDPTGQVNLSVGSQPGELFVQDITVTKISDVVPRGPERSDALVPNGTFSRGFLYWEPLYWAETPPTGISITEGRMRYVSGDKKRERWHAQLGTTVALRKGARYALSFDLLAGSHGDLGIELFENGRDLNKDGNTLSPNAPYMIVQTTPGEWQQIKLTFVATEDDPKSRLCFSLGDLSGTTFLDNVVMTPEP